MHKSTRAAVLQKKEGEKDGLVLLMLGRDDLLLLAYLNSSAVLSDNDIPIWRNGEPHRVRTNSLESRSIARN